MRLFIAIPLAEETKEKLFHIGQHLRETSIEKASFTRAENFHMTLAFLGETERVDDLKQCMNQIQSESFLMNSGKLGSFKRQGGDICFFNVKKNTKLIELHAQLTDQLRHNGFSVEKRTFQPHFTLARKVIWKHSGVVLYDEYEDGFTIDVHKISLMKSERIQGKLIYTEIYDKKLL